MQEQGKEEDIQQNDVVEEEGNPEEGAVV